MSKKIKSKPAYDLRFNVAQLLKEGTGGIREYEIKAQFEQALDEEIFVVAPLEGQVKFLRTGPNILVSGLLHSAVQKICGRCLSPFVTPVAVELEEEFYPTTDIVTGAARVEPPDVDEANKIDEQNVLDLSDVVRQELVVMSDGILYCQADCQGLCPSCGQNRNLRDCSCQEQPPEPRWNGLLALQKIEPKNK